MAPGNAPLLSYHSHHYRVRLELTRSMALSSPLPPSDLVQRAKAKLESVMKEGKIAGFEIYDDKLRQAWAGLRNADGAPSNTTVTFTLGAGSPDLPWLKIENAGAQKPGIYLTTSGTFDVKSIPREWVLAHVIRMAKQSGHSAPVFLPHLQSAIMRLYSGEALNKFHIASAGSIPAVPMEGKVFTVMANKSRSEVVVFIADVEALQTEASLAHLVTVIKTTVEKMAASGAPAMRVLKDEMIACVKGAFSGPERVKVNLPLAVLAAIPVAPPGPMVFKAPAKKYLNLKISADRMSATIATFDMNVYKDPGFKVSKDFLIDQCQMSSVRFGVESDLVAAIEDAANKRQNLAGMTIARGRAAVKGSEPYLHLTHKDAPEQKSSNEVVNIRDAQQRMVVRKGQLVAEARFKQSPVIGSDVVGHPVLPEVGDTLAVTVGEGIQQREPGKFYALFDGLPKFEEGTLTIAKSIVLEGDVNLKSGNIYFDGPVEIKGNVDVGALVRVRGPLIIHGSIIGGTVISQEPIEVMGSIVTGETGRVYSKSQIKADFIENSRIECDGSLVVNKSIVNCQVKVAKLIQSVAADGIIGGGTIMCGGIVHAANIGFAKGARTTFKVGANFKMMMRVEIRQKRHSSLVAAQERYKNEFRELAGKRENQLTQKHKDRKESLKSKMSGVKPMIEKAALALEVAKSNVTYNQDAIIAASNVFASNCVIEISGQGVVMETDTIAAAVSAKKRRDTHLVTYDEIKHDIEKQLAGAAQSSAPASGDSKKAG